MLYYSEGSYIRAMKPRRGLVKGRKMLRKVKLVIKYWDMVQQILEFAEVAVKATADGKITQKEKSALMKEFWDIINTAKALRK